MAQKTRNTNGVWTKVYQKAHRRNHHSLTLGVSRLPAIASGMASASATMERMNPQVARSCGSHFIAG
jgi:hypothetical protein